MQTLSQLRRRRKAQDRAVSALLRLVFLYIPCAWFTGIFLAMAIRP